jgi:hypothetical protein
LVAPEATVQVLSITDGAELELHLIVRRLLVSDLELRFDGSGQCRSAGSHLSTELDSLHPSTSVCSPLIQPLTLHRFPSLKWLVLATFLMGLLPSPVWQMSLEGIEDFPCRGHRCGCRSAQQCKSRCCCYTAVERAAWAQRRGRSPKQYLAAWESVDIDEPVTLESEKRGKEPVILASATCCPPSPMSGAKGSCCKDATKSNPKEKKKTCCGKVQKSPIHAAFEGLDCRGGPSAFLSMPWYLSTLFGKTSAFAICSFPSSTPLEQRWPSWNDEVDTPPPRCSAL